MSGRKHILKRMLACAVVVFVAVTATIMSSVVGPELPKWSEAFVTRASAASEGHYTYSVSKGKATITDVNDSISGNVTIPSKLGGYPVTGIGDKALYKCTGLTSVTIPDSVTSIGEEAFNGCTRLKSVTIGKNMKNIGFYAFYNCTGLTRINWNAESVNDLYYIEDDVGGCCSMEAFCNAGTAGDGIDVVFGDNVKTIPDYTFYSESYGDYDDCGPKIKTVTIGKSVTSIGVYAFSDCTDLTSVTIPDSVTNIGYRAFNNTAWYNAKPDGDIYAGRVYYKYKGTMPANTNIVIKEGTKSVAHSAFGYCTDLTNVTIPNSVTSIGEHAFENCIGLTSVTIPDSVTSIGEEAFYHCTGLTSVTFGNSVKSIGDGAFANCTGLTSVTIPDSVTSIDEDAFINCTGLTSVTIGNSVTSIGCLAFYQCTGLKNITIPDSVTNIDNYAFAYCSGLKSVTIGKNVKRIGNSAFYECTDLKSISIPDSVTSIGHCAFCDCTGLKSVTIGKSVTNIGDYAFENCTGLTSVTIPDSVKKIGSEAFSGCNTQIKFTGKPPAFSSDTFSGLKGTVLYPYKISEWKSAIKSKYGGQFTWVCYSKGKVTELKIKSMPKKTVYYQGQTANYSGLSLSAKWSDGFSAVITPDSKIYDVTISGFSSKTPGLKTVTATVGGKSVKFRLGVHKLNTFTESKSKYPESAHNYANNLKETKTYKCTNALRLVVTFSNKTYVEKDGDYIYVNGTRYTGNQLAGKTITIKGDTLTVKLVSNNSGRGYGYSIDKIVITRVEHVNKTRITPATTAKDGTVVTACEACGKVAKKAVIYKASSVKLSRTAYTYNGKVQRPTVTVKNSKGTTLKNGTHYTVTYSSGCKTPGKYAVKITFKVYYTGTKTLYFTIAPATPTLTVAAGTKKATLKWSKQTGATGYVVYMATSKTGKYSRIAVLKGNSAVSFTKTGLTKGRTYYFKVAAYKTVGSSNLYGSFSSVKAVKVK